MPWTDTSNDVTATADTGDTDTGEIAVEIRKFSVFLVLSTAFTWLYWKVIRNK